MSEQRQINLAEMSDDEINNLDPSTLGQDIDDNASNPRQDEEDQSATGRSDEDNVSDDTDGAESDNQSSDDSKGGADFTFGASSQEAGDEEDESDAPVSRASSDQGGEKQSGKPSTTSESSSELDYKSEYSKLMAPFKAAKREVRVESPEDARRLMQMGVDYARKMESMKPYQQVLKTLEKNNLLSIEKVNFLIDLDKKNPEAIKKFFKDSNIDPMELDLEDGATYSPTNHMVSESEMALGEILDEIRETPQFNKTVDVITNKWDTASKKLLMDNPYVIRYINDHIESGVYDLVSDRMANERIFGKHAGLSDLEAYQAVGVAMQNEGQLMRPTHNASSSKGNTNQGFSQDSGSRSAEAENLRNRKRAASPTRGNASTGKRVPNFGSMTDEEIEKFDIHSL